MSKGTEIQNYLPELYHESIISLLCDQQEFESLRAQLIVSDVKSGELLVVEGHHAPELLVVLEGEAELFSHQKNEEIISGSVTPFRSINIYSVIRSLPHQYSARMKTNGVILKIPISLIDDCFDKKESTKKYLLEVTESIEIRNLAKELDGIGCAQDFKIEFISSLEKIELNPHQLLVGPNDLIQNTIYIFEGQIISQAREKINGKLQNWPLQLRTWHFWKETINSGKMVNAIKSTSKTKGIQLSRNRILRLKDQFPDDFEKINQRILDGQTVDADEQNSDKTDIEELFKSSSKKWTHWKKFPWVAQLEQMDCGPACMSMICQYYGRNVSLQFWRHHLSTNKTGTSLYDLAIISERNGFISAAVSVEEITDLSKHYLPAIALRQNHYLVIYAMDKKGLTVGDPAQGLYKMSYEDFNKGFEKVLLILRPNEKFSDLPARSFKYSHFFQLLAGFKSELFVSALISFLMIFLGLSTPMISQIFMDDVLVRKDLNLMWLLFAGGISVAVVQMFLSWSKAYYSNYLASKLDYKLNSILLKKILSLPYKFHAERHVGDFTLRFHDLNKLRSFLIQDSESIMIAIFSLMIYGTALFFYAPTIAIGVMCSIPIFVVISFLSGRRLSQLNKEIFTHSADVESSLSDTIKGIAAIKSLGGELASRWRYEEKIIKVLKAERSYGMAAEGFGLAFSFYSEIIKYVIMGLSVFLAIKGHLSPGQVLAVSILAVHVFDPLIKITDKFGEIQEMISVLDRLNDVLLVPGEDTQIRGHVRKENLRGEIEFRNVWFRYGGEGSDWVLKDLNFKIESGTKLAVVGPSGSGKSTIVGLLTRMFEPTKGQILIDGKNYLEYDIKWLRDKVGVLHQESQLFGGSLLENIAFSDPEIESEKVVTAAKMANAHEFIENKPGGYDYCLSHGGSGLSGGEKQRIALARMFYKKPSIIVLDEATSALDGQAENILLQNLIENSNGITTINIAHRHSTVMASDLIMIMKAGSVQEIGVHEQLMNNNETYQKLFYTEVINEELEKRVA